MKTLAELSIEARNVLYERLGVSDTVRFLNQFRNFGGDYTKERNSVYDDQSVEDVAARIEARRAEKPFG